MFVGRERELKKLNLMYQSNQFEFAVLYGRRRVGKTTLIREFMKEKPGVYYISVEGTKRENISGLSKALLSNGDLKHGIAEFHDFEALLSYIDSIALSGERMVIAIDEYPYLAVSYPAISSLIQSHIDRCWKDSRLFLILCGSSMSVMEEQVLG
ncbi:MAG: ATP-binding protein [Lachnospiraceae bacterium]|nr:ATP-binding protein [Lachnospiraceae bacterium]